MELFQILECSGTLGTCCSDAALVGVLGTTRKIFELIQFIAPIILIVSGTIQFVQLTINPELKDGFRKVLNKIIAAIIIFVLPVLVDAVLTTVPNSVSVASCWEEAKISDEINKAASGTYIDVQEKNNKVSVVIDPSKYIKGPERPTPTPGASGPNQGVVNAGVGEGTATGKAIVAYASKYVGKKYKFGGTWNGEDPYVPTDCSGFVRGVYLHFGVSLPHGTRLLWNDKSKYDLVTSGNIQAGDVIMYNGHVGILTGNGNEIIHAKGKKWGVVRDKDYTKCSSKAILGILRIRGIN